MSHCNSTPLSVKWPLQLASSTCSTQYGFPGTRKDFKTKEYIGIHLSLSPSHKIEKVGI